MIQKCEKCSCQFSKKKIIKSIFFGLGYQPIECDNCRTKHYVDFTTRVFIALGIGIPLFIYPGSKRIIMAFGKHSILVGILWVGVFMGLVPFFARYHIKK